VDTSKELKPNGSLNVISFCSGYGGIERGLDLVGVNHRVLAYVEIESFAIANLANKMESGELDAAPIYTDLKTFPAHLFRGCVDLITGGYPCQPFSAAGRRRGEDDPRHLWPHIRRHVNAIEPLQCFFENVEGHISLGLNSVISDMEEDGYDSTWGIFSASEVGAPHQRKRVFILANAIGHPLWEQPRWGSGKDGQGQALTGIDGEAQPMADTDSSRFEQGNEEVEGQPSEQPDGHSLQPTTTHADIEGLEGRLRREVTDSQRWQEQEVRRTAQCSHRGSRDRHSGWTFEPRVDRVVDGCSDRVDRIRMLGNGVVPQTSAKAWEVLNEQIIRSH